MHNVQPCRSSSVLVIGSINTDLVLTVSRHPEPGENVIGETFCRVPGGKGANQAVAAARLGADVTLFGKLGGDFEAASLIEQLAAEGIRTQHIISDPLSKTGLAVILVDAAGQNRIVVFPCANMELRKDELHAAFRSGSFDAVLLQLEIPEVIVLEACRMADEAGIPAVLDAGPAQAFPLEALCPVEIISPNETEALALTGIEIRSREDAERAARVILRRSRARAVVIKMGRAGALLMKADGKAEYCPGHQVEAVDPTAAGDAFTAAMTLAYLETGDLLAAVEAGNISGALATTKLGAQPSLPSAAEVGAFSVGTLQGGNNGI
jgi:ribokinase